MNAVVVQEFIDKNTGDLCSIGDVIVRDDERVAELASLGFVEAQKEVKPKTKPKAKTKAKKAE